MPLRELKPPVRGPRITAAVLKEFSEPLGFLRTEPDNSSRLAPWFFERVTHVSDDRLGGRLP